MNTGFSIKGNEKQGNVPGNVPLKIIVKKANFFIKIFSKSITIAENLVYVCKRHQKFYNRR